LADAKTYTNALLLAENALFYVNRSW